MPLGTVIIFQDYKTQTSLINSHVPSRTQARVLSWSTVSLPGRKSNHSWIQSMTDELSCPEQRHLPKKAEEWDPPVLGKHSLVTFVRMGTTFPVCHSIGTATMTMGTCRGRIPKTISPSFRTMKFSWWTSSTTALLLPGGFIVSAAANPWLEHTYLGPVPLFPQGNTCW